MTDSATPPAGGAPCVIAAADLHLGRRPARLPGDLGVAPRELGPAAAWRALVDEAIRRRAAAVVLAGDVVDADNDLFEAYGRLESGVRELVAAGIEVLAVAGNHDVDTLPQLARAIDGFRLLGTGGRWETAELLAGGRVWLRIAGWSFPERVVSADPLASAAAEVWEHDPETPLVGILHADLDAAESRYAPVRRSDLLATGADAWLLGHVHVPTPLPPSGELNGWVGYLGSTVGLDPSETGARGALVLTCTGGRLTGERIDLAPLRWERVEIDAGESDLAHAPLEPLKRALERLGERIDASGTRPRAVGVRVALVGRRQQTLTPGRLREIREAMIGTISERDGMAIFVESVVDLSRPPLDLERLARETDPPGRLARALLAIERGDGEGDAWLDAVRSAVGRSLGAPAFSAIERPEPDDAALRRRALAIGERLLETMIGRGDSPA